MAFISSIMGGQEKETENIIERSNGTDGGGIEGDPVDEFGRSLELLKWVPLDAATMSPAKRAACYELLRRGDISWFLHPEQNKLLNWLESERRELAVIVCSRQWGKTIFALFYCVITCITKPRTSVLFVAPHKVGLINYMLPKMNVVFSFLPEDLIPTKAGGKWTFRNGSIFRIDGVTVGGGARLRGDTVDLVILDECREMDGLNDIIESSISPMLTTTNGRLVMISTPPESPLHSFTDFYIRQAIESSDFYTTTYKTNPLLSSKRLKYLMEVQYKGGEKNVVFRREYMADYSVADPEKRVVREWDEEANDRFFESYKGIGNKACRPYISMDYGFSDPCGIIAGYYDAAEGCLIIEDEFFLRGMNSDEVGLQLLKMEKELKERLPGAVEPIRVMDIAPQLMRDLYTRFSLRFEPSYKVPSMVAMLNRLRVAFVEGKIRIRPSCVNLRFQLLAGVFDSKGVNYLRTGKGGHLDLLDALKYVNLNLRWNEVLDAQQALNERNLPTGQFYVGPFGRSGNFRDGQNNRPV